MAVSSVFDSYPYSDILSVRGYGKNSVRHMIDLGRYYLLPKDEILLSRYIVQQNSAWMGQTVPRWYPFEGPSVVSHSHTDVESLVGLDQWV